MKSRLDSNECLLQMPDGIKGEDFLQNIRKYGSGIVKTVTVKMPDLEEPKPLTTDDEYILSTTTTPEGKRISRDEFFRMLKNEHEDRFSELIIPSAEPVLSAEDWLKTVRKWGSSLERDEMHGPRNRSRGHCEGFKIL